MSSSGYNANCTVQDCTQGCCNKYGTCPSTSSYSSSSYTTCKYYYSTNTSGVDAQILGVTIGPIIGFVVLIIIIVCCIKKCTQKTIE